MLLQRKMQIQHRKKQQRTQTARRPEEEPDSSAKSLKEGFEVRQMTTEVKKLEEQRIPLQSEPESQSTIRKKEVSVPRSQPVAPRLKRPTNLKAGNTKSGIPRMLVQHTKENKKFESRIPAMGTGKRQKLTKWRHSFATSRKVILVGAASPLNCCWKESELTDEFYNNYDF